MTREEVESKRMSKEEILDTLKGLVFGTFDRTTAKEREALDAVIEVLEAQEWTPCSDRPPETIGEYLITVLSNPSRNAITTAGYWNERLKEFGTFRQDGTWEKWDVVAWKPLPKPYKVKSEE